MAIVLRSPVNILSDKERLNSNQSKSFEKFWRNRCSHEEPYLHIWRKLILLEMIMYKINVSIRNDLKLLFYFVVSLFKTSLQISLYWLSTLVLSIFTVFVITIKILIIRYLTIFFVRLFYIKH
mgnify:CR=1 FL=1